VELLLGRWDLCENGDRQEKAAFGVQKNGQKRFLALEPGYRESKASWAEVLRQVVENWERLTTYYDFPREHWKHLRTSNVVESPFSRVRLRTAASRRFNRRSMPPA
jgi:transposase-like protein